MTYEVINLPTAIDQELLDECRYLIKEIESAINETNTYPELKDPGMCYMRNNSSKRIRIGFKSQKGDIRSFHDLPWLERIAYGKAVLNLGKCFEN